MKKISKYRDTFYCARNKDQYASVLLFDRLDSADGYDIYWIHWERDNDIEPEALYCQEHDVQEIFWEVMRDGEYHNTPCNVINYVSDIDEEPYYDEEYVIVACEDKLNLWKEGDDERS